MTDANAMGFAELAQACVETVDGDHGLFETWTYWGTSAMEWGSYSTSLAALKTENTYIDFICTSLTKYGMMKIDLFPVARSRVTRPETRKSVR